MATVRKYNSSYTGEHLNRIAFPMGGIGAGMICLEGTGALSHLSLRHRPDVYNEPQVFSALYVKSDGKSNAKVLEGPVPMGKAFGIPGSGNGLGNRTFGLPRFQNAAFTTRFPFAGIELNDAHMPVKININGWSPFTPGDSDNSSLPVCALEYTFTNTSRKAVEGVYSFHAQNFIRLNKKDDKAVVRQVRQGIQFVQPRLSGEPASAGTVTITADDAKTVSDCGWFRGGWFDAQTMAWNNVAAGKVVSGKPHKKGVSSVGGSLYVPFKLAPGKSKTVVLKFSWFVPKSDIRTGPDLDGECDSGDCCCSSTKSSKTCYEPWYAGRFKSADEVARFWESSYSALRKASMSFADCFYDTNLPEEVVEAVAANLTILKSPTCLRQKDGRFWAWEGCCDGSGCCHGSCTHVWNYAQALPHLFPVLARSLRETEFLVSQDSRGHQNFRTSLPIRRTDHTFHAAADGQLGGIMKTHREWRISGDTDWLKKLWPQVKKSLDYCIETWDPDRLGVLIEPHHNTYDIEFWGADGMCTSFYLGALKAASVMGGALQKDVGLYEKLLKSGIRYMDEKLWNGEFYIQKVQWKGLKAKDPTTALSVGQTNYSEEAKILTKKEGPKYQYGDGCISDGVLGEWIAEMCGIGKVLDKSRIKKNLAAIHRHNFKKDLSEHANPQRPSYAFGQEGGLLLCTWPDGGKPSLPFVYSDEVWTGIEYQVASHLMLTGQVKEGLEIVRKARDRYNGINRNPFNEYECGHWYARAMASYGMLQGLTGVRYDAVEEKLYLTPKIKGNWRGFISTATGFGTVGMKNGKPFLQVKQGKIKVRQIVVK